jgi:putative phosphoserine phosphatase / 1-acylglycerol-3-phosphate O-acyltransferase
MAGAAAFFDLDRTLLLGASGPIISAGLRAGGLVGPDRLGLERMLFATFDLVGETLPSIALTRLGARATRGWSRAAVQAVGAAVASDLVAAVQPYALQALRSHRNEGRRLVLATTTPFDLVEAMASELGFEAVLATRYGVDGAGRYTGSIDGEFVWSQGKARSAEVWARANQVDLADSYAYSDSVFDMPLLSMVGHPVAVNPDPRLLVLATARRWPTVWFNAPPGVPKPRGIEPQSVVARLARPGLFPWMRVEIEGAERLEGRAGLVLAANHRSYLDPLLVGLLGARAGRPVRFLAKKEVTDAPVVGSIVRSLGVIRVDRGTGSDEPLVAAAAALEAGELVALFPQGTIPRGPDFFRPELHGRYGAVRLALASGQALVPVGIWGSERAWPRSSRYPYILNLADPPQILIRVGQPYRPEPGCDPAGATADLMARIVNLLPPEAGQGRQPTDQELALTYPPG